MQNKGREFFRRLKTDFAFKTLFFATLSFAASVSYGVFNGVQGLLYRSVWYGALSAYYILLALLRGGVLLYHGKRRKRKRGGKEENERLRNLKTYRNCGVLLLLLHLALSVAIAQMIFNEQAFSYAGWTIYGAAAYAFYKITVAIVNMVRARREDDFTVRAVRSVNLADGTVSVLALQTALLSTFGTEDLNASAFNTATGIAVSVLTVALGVFMIVEAQTHIKKNKLGENITNE